MLIRWKIKNFKEMNLLALQIPKKLLSRVKMGSNRGQFLTFKKQIGNLLYPVSKIRKKK